MHAYTVILSPASKITFPSVIQRAAVFLSSRATCWRSCSTSSCLRIRLRCSCRSIKTRHADCCPPSQNKRKRNPDFTRRGPMLASFHLHIGSSGLMVSMGNDGVYFGRLFKMLVDLIFVFAGWNDKRLDMQSWRQQQRYVSASKSHRTQTWNIISGLLLYHYLC